MKQEAPDLVRTGVSGLDTILNGGLLRTNSCLIEGAPGSGKTTLGIQVLVEGARTFGEGGIILSFEEFPQQLYRDAGSFGWDLVELEAQKKLKVLCTSPQALERMAGVTGGIWDEMIGEVRAKRVLVDSVTHFQRITNDPAQLRELLYRFLNGLKNRGLTTFLTKEITSRKGGDISFEEYVVDAALVLSHDPGFPGRALEVHKTRGREFLAGAHSLAIGSSGLVIYPNRPPSMEIETTPELERLPTGIEELDAMTQGGLFAGGSVFLCGRAGTGKTTLALQILANGTMKYKEKGLYLSFEELPSEILKKTDLFGWSLREAVANGDVEIHFVDQTAVNIDEIIYILDRKLGETGAKRVVIDSLDVLFSSMGDRRRFREKLYFLSTIVRKHRAAGLFIGGVGHDGNSLGKHGIEATLLDGVVYLGAEDEKARARRHIQVSKIRNSDHAEGAYPLIIGPQGVQIFYTPPADRRRVVAEERDVDFSPVGEILENPIPYGTAWHVVGDTGVGKTIFGAQFLVEGLRRGEKAVFVACDEYPSKIRQDLQNFGFAIGVYEANGGLAFVNAYAPEGGEEAYLVRDRGDANELIYVIRQAIAKVGTPCRVLVDSVTSLGVNYAAEEFTTLVHEKNRVLNDPGVSHLDLYVAGALQSNVAVSLLNAYDVTLELYYSREEGSVPKRNLRVRKIRGRSFDPRPFPYEIRRRVGITVDTAYYQK